MVRTTSLGWIPVIRTPLSDWDSRGASEPIGYGAQATGATFRLRLSYGDRRSGIVELSGPVVPR